MKKGEFISPFFLYTGKNGNVAHECIIDIRPIKADTGITEEDVAKRLIDFGFHTPTISWPVPGTMMIEPTESESLSELDQFCETLIKIKEEINKVKSGDFDKIDNPLKNAPTLMLNFQLMNENINMTEKRQPIQLRL